MTAALAAPPQPLGGGAAGGPAPQVGPLFPAEPAAQSPAADLRSCFHVSFCDAKGEDVSVVCKAIAPPSSMALYAVADGHNGSQAAKAVAAMLPGELSRQVAGAAGQTEEGVRSALARTFVATDEAVCQKFFQSGCTLTAAVVSGGDTLTIANVGDSRAFLDTGAEVIELTADHRIGASPAERARLEAAGGRLARLNEYGAGPSSGISDGVGPVRLWPGGIMVGRAIGDRDVGRLLIPQPHLRQVKLPPTGARLIMATDGLWDVIPAGRVARLLRNQGTPKGAAMQAVSSVASGLGGLLRDDVTVVVVDFLPPACADFRDVCKQFQGRLRTVLSNPTLSTLVMETSPSTTAANTPDISNHGGSALASVQEGVAVAPPPPTPALERKRSGLFACFARPSVRDPDAPSSLASGADGNRSLSSRSYSDRSFSGRGSGAGLGPWGSGAYGRSASLPGGCSERSVRSGMAREPSVHGLKKATSVQLLYEGDSALWPASELGRLPRLSDGSTGGKDSYSRRSSSSSVQRSSPRSLTDKDALGLSFGSLPSFEDDSAELQRSYSLPLATLSRKNSGEGGEKKTHGSSAAALLLLQAHPQ